MRSLLANGGHRMMQIRVKAHEEKIALKKAEEFKAEVDEVFKDSITPTRIVQEVLRIALPKAKLDKYGHVILDIAS
jgi:hypothetical protein